MNNFTIDSEFAKEASDIDINSFGVIPEGEYIGKFTEIETKEFSTSSGFSLKFVISEGQHSGMISNMFIPMKASNENAIKFSKLNLKKLFLAAGHNKVGTDLSEVLNKKIRIKIKHIKKEGKTYTSICDIFENVYSSGRVSTNSARETNNEEPNTSLSSSNNDDIPF